LLGVEDFDVMRACPKPYRFVVTDRRTYPKGSTYGCWVSPLTRFVGLRHAQRSVERIIADWNLSKGPPENSLERKYSNGRALRRMCAWSTFRKRQPEPCSALAADDSCRVMAQPELMRRFLNLRNCLHIQRSFHLMEKPSEADLPVRIIDLGAIAGLAGFPDIPGCRLNLTV
jgi:hypothetical protein